MAIHPIPGIDTGGGGITGGEAKSGSDGYQDSGGDVFYRTSGMQGGGQWPPPWPFAPDLGGGPQTNRLIYAGAGLVVIGVIVWAARLR